MSRATLVIVRAAHDRPDRNHAEDIDLAKDAARRTPCWIYVLGAVAATPKRKDPTTIRQQWRAARLARTRAAVGLADGTPTKKGVTVYAPVELLGQDTISALAESLARYLVDRGIPSALCQSAELRVRIAADTPPVFLAAIAEAVAVFPRVDLQVGADHLRASLRWEIRRDRFKAPPAQAGADLVGDSPAIQKVRAKIDRYAAQPFPVLIIGETGTGKEIAAKLLHARSGREGRFMPQNAAQLSPALADSLLFGHRKGAFTGADTDRTGRIREADGGTFFLDETFNLAPSVQAKLLRALNQVNEGIIVVESVGSTIPERVHARLVTSALQDPRTLDDASAMRNDLFYRVSVGIIRMPPLRQILDDLPALCVSLLTRLGQPHSVDPDAFDVLRAHDWPGNVRELELILLRAIMDAPANQTSLSAEHLTAALKTNQLPPGARSLPLPCNLALELKRIEVATLRAAMREAGHVQSKAGRRVGMTTNQRNFGRRLVAAETKLKEMEATP